MRISYGENHRWSEVKGFIERALNRGSLYTLDDVYQGLMDGSFQLWIAEDVRVRAVLVTSIQTSDVTFCLLVALGGDVMDDWIRYLSCVERWARENDCVEMWLVGRKGWSRVLGYEVWEIENGEYAMRKDIESA